MTDSSPEGTMQQTVAMLTSTQRLLRLGTGTFVSDTATPAEWHELVRMYDRALTNAIDLVRQLIPDLAADTTTEEP